MWSPQDISDFLYLCIHEGVLSCCGTSATGTLGAVLFVLISEWQIGPPLASAVIQNVQIYPRGRKSRKNIQQNHRSIIEKFKILEIILGEKSDNAKKIASDFLFLRIKTA